MRSIGALVRTVQQHPWSSFQDAALLASAMLVCILLAFEYDIVEFWEDLSPGQRRIRLDEMVVLTGLLGAGIVGFVLRRMREERSDFERRLRAEFEVREVRALAMRDPLTELPNRRELDAALDAMLAAAPADGEAHAVYVLDLNGFKRVNDEHGHAVGDEVLRAVARRLNAAARKGDLVARLGGDEFAVVSPAVGGRDKALELGNRLISAFENDIQLGNQSFTIGVSIGAALYPEDGRSASELMRRADFAMYRAKAGKSSTLRFVEPAGQGGSMPRRRLA